ncbi:asparaginase domain-containing protein [Pseudotabrizicola sp.]|uniref:asparaginase domain-containing protein n=1 Tax=Pseudotabrizicola sp. TaxID=2939647 RepID=UPI0027197B8E|nr:asparaginase domain-containing protein [Pseudotabrizicola sp.]MDO8883055.1 asparaginase domain-containing protein [Pseudotabrizicola sp.]
MTHLLILYTGGTIGMVPGPDGLQPGAGVLEAALATLTPPGVTTRVEHFTPLIDSANIRPSDWNHMLDRIDAWQGDGVIIVHGTDTMAYTGAALSSALSDLRLPVILCGSMAPLNTGGDAEANLSLALTSALTAPPEVWLAFAARLLPAAGLVKQDSHAADAFRSIAQAPLPAPARRFADRRLAILSLSPGLPAAALGAALAQLDGAVLRVYGAGTMMQDPALLLALQNAIANGSRLRAVSQCENGGLMPAAYAAGAALWSVGVDDGGIETAELALARLWLSLS